MFNKARLLTALCVIFVTPLACSQTASSLFAEAKAAQAAGKRDVAFLLHRQILRLYPDSQYAEKAQFLVGQYYYDTHNYFDADQTLRAFLQRYPRSEFTKAARGYLANIRLGSLKERADRLFEEGKLDAARALYEQYLDVNPGNSDVKAQLEQITKIQRQVHFGFEQLDRERKKLEQEKDGLNRQLAELEDQKKELQVLRKQALELNQLTVQKYEKKLAANDSQLEALNSRVSALEKELKEWRHRTVMLDAARLSRPLAKGLRPVSGGEPLPRIVFEGERADPSPQEGEAQVSGIVRDGFPAVVITRAGLDARRHVRHLEAIVNLELSSPWPEGAKMKFRVDFVPKKGEPPPDPQFLVRYYEAADMDEIDESTNSYRKRELFTADQNRVERYEVSAFLVKSK